MSRLPIQGQYPPDWDQIGDRVRAEAGNRCIRCGHPYTASQHGNGEETRCDGQCTHAGPIYIWDFQGLEKNPCSTLVAGDAVRNGYKVTALWRVLTVHHLDGDKSNCRWWNLLALCQRCHLQVQGKINPQIPYFLEHSTWAKPYIAGFYAHKYEGRQITREEAERRLEELLAYERKA